MSLEAENVERVSESSQPSVCLSTRIRGSSPSSCGSSPLNITSTPPPDTCSPGGKKVYTQTPFPFQYVFDSISSKKKKKKGGA